MLITAAHRSIWQNLASVVGTAVVGAVALMLLTAVLDVAVAGLSSVLPGLLVGLALALAAWGAPMSRVKPRGRPAREWGRVLGLEVGAVAEHDAMTS